MRPRPSRFPRAFAPVLALLWAGQIGSAEDTVRSGDAAGEPADRETYERQRREAHARLAAGEDTMYASTPSPPETFPLHLPAPHRYLGPEDLNRRARAWGVDPAAATPAASDDVEDAAAAHRVAFFPSAADPVREGFVRVINHELRPGTVDIHAIDDAGRRFGPAALAVGAGETVHFNSGDLETGDAGKGLSRATGPGEGDWRLELDSGLDIEVLAYVRTADGFLTSMHDTVAAGETGRRVAFFNPGGNEDQASRLRVVNVGGDTAEVAVTGVDDAGVPGLGEVRFAVPSGAARTVTARELESGDGLDGALGDGAGKWRLLVRSAGDIEVLNLLDSPAGHVANLSTAPDLRDGGAWRVPLFPEADDASQRQGFVRVVSRDDADGTVLIDAFDDTDRDYEPVVLTLPAGGAAHFNSHDLENGNPGKGLSGGVGAGEGAWRLALSSELDLEVLAYVRTADGFLAAMHDTVPARGSRHRVPVFNPASNRDQASRLRVVNSSDGPAAVAVTGLDGEGRSPGTVVRFTVAAGAARSVSARELETGDGLDGALGDGAGKWQLHVSADRPVVVMSLLESPAGHLANLSTAGSRRVRTAEEVFEELISPSVVQAKCVNCHVEGGMSGNTRLVFVPDSEDGHEARNLAAFRDFVGAVDGAAALVLDKIQGVGHGGGIQVAAGSEAYGDMRAFLDLLAGDVDAAGPALTADELFDTVRMESARRTLYRAGLVFAGRIPTAEELAPFPGGTAKQLRDAIRGMMTGPGFHDFLVVGANDRLLTESLRWDYLMENGRLETLSTDDFPRFPGYKRIGGNRHRSYARYGAVQAPVELIAHVAENDLPYTEILTADYVMANGTVAKAFRDDVEFDDPEDPFEFRPARIREYIRYVGRDEVTMHDYPHAGVLNTLSFLRRYPTTPTNRNRARSRWAYHHFLGVDIENAVARIDDDALFDTRNPTMHNPACTVCHIALDPVAGALQNYTATGFYRPRSVHGRGHALDRNYTAPDRVAEYHTVDPARAEPLEITEHAVPMTTETSVVLRLRTPNRDGDSYTRSTVWVNAVSLRDYDTGIRYAADLGAAIPGWTSGIGRDWYVVLLDHPDTGEPAVRIRVEGTAHVPVDIPEDARYDITAEVWAEDTGETGELAVGVNLFRLGDTWYRDMREPGFEGAAAPDADASARWLGERMAEDPRFAEGAVKFWWPAVMGDEVARPPAAGDRDFEARLVAATAQAAEVERLADGFRRGFHDGDRPYNLRDLLAAMVLSPWFRAERNLDDDPRRRAALRDAGARRLLTPEELAAKTGSVTGYQWGRWFERIWRESPRGGDSHILGDSNSLVRQYELVYGGIDSATKMARSRNVTPAMAAVAKAHAAQSGCPVVLREFYLLPEERRRLFGGIALDTLPDTEAGEAAIRDKLVELHYKLLGIEVAADSADVDAAFGLFADTVERRRRSNAGPAFRDGIRCDTDSDIRILEGVVDPPFAEVEFSYPRRWEQNDPDGLLGRTYEDPDYLARTWAVVLAYLMMDYRYLYL